MKTTSGSLILIHSVISLPDASSYDNKYKPACKESNLHLHQISVLQTFALAGSDLSSKDGPFYRGQLIQSNDHVD